MWGWSLPIHQEVSAIGKEASVGHDAYCFMLQCLLRVVFFVWFPIQVFQPSGSSLMQARSNGEYAYVHFIVMVPYFVALLWNCIQLKKDTKQNFFLPNVSCRLKTSIWYIISSFFSEGVESHFKCGTQKIDPSWEINTHWSIPGSFLPKLALISDNPQHP